MSRLLTNHTTASKEPRSRAPGELSLASILQFIRFNWKFMLPLVFGTLILGVIYALAAPPVFQANALIKVDISESAAKNNSNNLISLLEAKSATSAEIEMIKTRAVVSRAVDQYKLDIIAQPKRMPVVGSWFARKAQGLSSPGLFGYGHTAWGNESIEVIDVTVPIALASQPLSILAGPDGTYLLRVGNSIELTGRVGVELRETTPEGELALLITRLEAKPGIAFSLAKISRDDAIESLQKALVISERGKQSGLIGISIEGPNPILNANVVNAVARQYIQQNIDLKTEDTERSLVFLDSQLPAMKAAIDAAEARYSTFRNARGSIDVGEESRSVLQQSVGAQTRLSELKQKMDELLTRFNPGNHIVEGVNQQIRTVNGEIAQINEKIRRLPGTEQELVRLTRDVKVNSELYSNLLNTAQQLRLSKASRVGSAKLIDSAVVSSTPVGPKRGLIIIGSAIAGLVLALFAAFFRKALKRSIDSQQGLAHDVGVPLIAVVPHSKFQAQSDTRRNLQRGRVSLLAREASDEGAVESLRALRTALKHAVRGASNNIVLVTGPTPQVGKSFIAVNLSVVFANAGNRVLLVDGDLRGGHLHRCFGNVRGAGLAELIVGQAQVREAVAVNVLPGLDFLSTGSLDLQPDNAFASANLGQLLTKFSSSYDYVIIDSAPVLAVADSLMLASHAGIVFCVARKGYTTLEQLCETTARFEQTGKPVDGIVFNDALPTDLAYGYGADYKRRIEVTPQANPLLPIKP